MIKRCFGECSRRICSVCRRQTDWRRCHGPGPKANCVCVCVCVCQTAPYLHAATVLLRGSFTHQCVCAPSPRRYKWPRERLFNGGEQREGSTGRQTARLRDLTPARHANPSKTSYLLCPISWASKGGNAIRCSYIMKERPNRTERVLLCVAHVRAGL